MKGTIQPDHMPVNKFELRVGGLVDLNAITISGIEEAIERVVLPDRTAATGGQKQPGEFTLEIALHHDLEVAALEAWYKEAQDPVLPTYKKPCTLVHKSLSGIKFRHFTLIGVWVSGRKLPDLDKENEGELARNQYTMSYDDIIPL